VSDNLRSLAAQLLLANRDLVPHAFDSYANKSLLPSVTHVRKLIADLLSMIQVTLIFIDGVDEYPISQQRSMLGEILPFAKTTEGCARLSSHHEMSPPLPAR
jgi:hypothetical protein